MQEYPYMTNEKTVAILQSNYIPWKGYFDIIRMADVFVLYDNVQYTRRDWRNRNRIKTANGPKWLTIPVLTKGKYDQLIKDTRIDGDKWLAKHWNSIAHSYAHAPSFGEYEERIHEAYISCTSKWLSEVNRHFLSVVCDVLGITTTVIDSGDFNLRDGRSERLLGICEDLGATKYISGPAAMTYLDTEIFSRHGISVEWFDYSNYREYPQVHPPFMHDVSILDLIFNTGDKAFEYIATKQ